MASLGDDDDWVAEALAMAFFDEGDGDNTAAITRGLPALDDEPEPAVEDEADFETEPEPNSGLFEEKERELLQGEADGVDNAGVERSSTALGGLFAARESVSTTASADSSVFDKGSRAGTAVIDTDTDTSAVTGTETETETTGDAEAEVLEVSDSDTLEAESDDDVAEDSDDDERSSSIRGLVEWVVVLVGAVVVALLLRAYVVHAYYIPSESMESTLLINDRVLVNKLSYDLHGVNRGDVVVFRRPDDEQAEIRDLIKRVIGLEGETVEGRDNQVFINGVPLEEPYLTADEFIGDFGPVTVEENHVFVMGDNRDESSDSRYFGAIAEDRIIGRAFVLFWPLNRLGTL